MVMYTGTGLLHYVHVLVDLYQQFVLLCTHGLFCELIILMSLVMVQLFCTLLLVQIQTSLVLHLHV